MTDRETRSPEPRRTPALSQLCCVLALTLVAIFSGFVGTGRALPGWKPVAEGTGGAVVSDTLPSTKAGLSVLRHGGTAADAAVAVAATLGVTDPYVAGIGGDGYFVYYDAKTRRVYTLDGRAAAPAAASRSLLIDPATGQPYDFSTAVTSGLSVGTPGTLATWVRALRRWGRRSLTSDLASAREVAARGFRVDQVFHDNSLQNAQRFGYFSSTGKLFLPGGHPPAVGSIFRNPDLARTYAEIGHMGQGALYGGPIGRDVIHAVHELPLAPGSTLKPIPGLMTLADLRRYKALDQPPIHIRYRGVDIYTMAPSSSGGTTIGEALNILRRFNLSHAPRVKALHDYLDATVLAFADRNRYVGDPHFVKVPTRDLLSAAFAAHRACLIKPSSALLGPLDPGTPLATPGQCARPAAGAAPAATYNSSHTNHLVVEDKYGDIASYTTTIEQIGGSGIVVPGRGFLLNNDNTDFNFAPVDGFAADPNLPAGGKRPRSSMSPTIVLRHGKPFLAIGLPGGPTIISGVLEILLNRLDFQMTLPQAIAAPRMLETSTLTARTPPINGGSVIAEDRFTHSPAVLAGLRRMGYKVIPVNVAFGDAAGLELLGHGRVLAAGEPRRYGGTSAGVVRGG